MTDDPTAERDPAAWARTVMSGYDDAATAYDDDRSGEIGVPFVEDLTADLPDGARVLDVGCGGGRTVLETVADEYEAIGVDLSAEQVSLARERVPSAQLARADMTQLPVTTGTVDALTALYSIIHVPREHHAAVFDEFARVLRPGGRLLLTTGVGAWEGANDDWLDSGASMQWSFHGRERSLDLLEDVGFEVVEDAVVGDELDDGEWLFVRARLPE